MNTISTAMQPGMGTNSLNLLGLNSPVVNPGPNMYPSINNLSGITMNTGNLGLYGQPQPQPTQPTNLNLFGSVVSTANTSIGPNMIGGAANLPFEENFTTEVHYCFMQHFKQHNENSLTDLSDWFAKK
jgi:hypothetical protein